MRRTTSWLWIVPTSIIALMGSPGGTALRAQDNQDDVITITVGSIVLQEAASGIVDITVNCPPGNPCYAVLIEFHFDPALIQFDDITLDPSSGDTPNTIAGIDRHDRRSVGSIPAAVYSPDGRWLVSGSADQTVRVWDLLAD